MSRIGNSDVADGVGAAAADRADRQTVAAVAVAVGEGDMLAGVDGQAVILVIHGGAVDGDIRAGADGEGIHVVAQACTSGVVDQDVGEVEVIGLDTEGLDWGVVHLQTDDGGLLEGVGGGELGLDITAGIASLALPSAGTVAVDLGAGGLLHGVVGDRHGDHGTGPFVGGSNVKDDLSKS